MYKIFAGMITLAMDNLRESLVSIIRMPTSKLHTSVLKRAMVPSKKTSSFTVNL
ncbi:hypothetical protein Golax_016009 [Gossypium laxum]|uniref:Uncharacterized protein n=1 Tax=Gossypium laxum TaxID=34288 RepID=A0A7J8YVW0_9ROSI|nr:hypothetical protein [Gossypium laxum]